MQHDYQFVPKTEWLPVRKELEKLINDVQHDVRNEFTFSFTYVGSSGRNMVTMDLKSNVGYDFDVNIHINDEEENYSASQIKHILMKAINKYVHQYGYDYCEDSTRVITFGKNTTLPLSIAAISVSSMIVMTAGNSSFILTKAKIPMTGNTSR